MRDLGLRLCLTPNRVISGAELRIAISARTLKYFYTHGFESQLFDLEKDPL